MPLAMYICICICQISKPLDRLDRLTYTSSRSSFAFAQYICIPLQIEEYERSLGECRLLISQHEARCASLAESMREAENKKRQLEEAADTLREECARLQVTLKILTYFCMCKR